MMTDKYVPGDLKESDVLELLKQKLASSKQPHKFSEKQLLNGVPFNQVSPANQLSLAHCSVCDKFFSKGTCVDCEGTPTCHHCVMWFNYSEENRSIVESGVFGINIAQYVLQYREHHDPKECTRSDTCFLCDNLNGKFIEGISDGELIQGDNKPTESEDDEERMRIEI
jgi:hypothetical protein